MTDLLTLWYIGGTLFGLWTVASFSIEGISDFSKFEMIMGIVLLSGAFIFLVVIAVYIIVEGMFKKNIRNLPESFEEAMVSVSVGTYIALGYVWLAPFGVA